MRFSDQRRNKILLTQKTQLPLLEQYIFDFKLLINYTFNEEDKAFA